MSEKRFYVALTLYEDRGSPRGEVLLTTQRSPDLDLAWAGGLFNAFVQGVREPRTVLGDKGYFAPLDDGTIMP
jgi:hypothetical protein